MKEVEYIDTHDDVYIDMLMQQPLIEEQYLINIYSELESFLVNIFKQGKENAFRRVRYFSANNHEGYLKDYGKQYERTPKIIHRIKKLETMKKVREDV